MNSITTCYRTERSQVVNNKIIFPAILPFSYELNTGGEN